MVGPGLPERTAGVRPRGRPALSPASHAELATELQGLVQSEDVGLCVQKIFKNFKTATAEPSTK